MKNKKNSDFRTALNIVKSYRHKSVFFKFWLRIIYGFLIVFLVVTFLVDNYKSSEYYNNISVIMSKNMYNIRNALDSVFAEVVLNEKKLNTELNAIENAGETGEAISVEAIEQVLNGVLEKLDFIKSIYLYYPENNYIVSSSIVYRSSERDAFDDITWLDAYYNGESEIFLRKYPEASVFQNCISVCAPIDVKDRGEVLAVFNIKYDKMNIIKNLNLFMDYEVNMINNDGMIIYSTDTDKIAKNISGYKELNSMFFEAADNYIVNTEISKKELVESIQTKNIKLFVVAKIPTKDIDILNGDMNSIMFIAIGLILVLLLISIYMATGFYGSIAGFFNRLSDKQEGNNERSSNEIADIDDRISNIIAKKSETETELADSLMQLQRSQSIALQSQFSPHFLFNTLQLINAMAISEIGHDGEVNEAVSLLCDLLCVAMDTTEYTCKFRDELKYAEKYITLQNMKYEDAFDIKFDIQEETLDLMVAKLSLQPILENSMHHGYDSRREKMNIIIRSYIDDEKLIIQVEDDGVGMSEERKEEVMKNLENKQIEKKDSIGLLNLNQRIKLIFGFGYGCMIDNNGSGVTVTISFPNR